MAIESSILPLPSEFVIPSSGTLAHSEGRFSMIGIVIASALGSWVGATVMYWVARLAGRPLVLRYGRYLLISEEKVHGAERWAARFGPLGVFASRLLPVVRHLIGIPAGIVQMNFKLYSIYTCSGRRCGPVFVLGRSVAGNDKELMAGSVHRISLWGGGGVLVLGLLYYSLVHRFMKSPRGDSAE
jgi:membrane protein DedA with SNARE-associated domain